MDKTTSKTSFPVRKHKSRKLQCNNFILAGKLKADNDWHLYKTSQMSLEMKLEMLRFE